MAIKTYEHVKTGRKVRAAEGSRLSKLLAKDDGYKVVTGKGGARSTSKADGGGPASSEG